MRITLALIATFAIGCCTGIRAPDKPHETDLVREISTETVAFIARDPDGDAYPFCSGVWVGPKAILTAAHCASAMLPDTDEAPIGTELVYITRGEVGGIYTDPTNVHQAALVKLDVNRDLALLVAPNAPSHRSAHLGTRILEAGETLHLIGHAMGFYWTYQRGPVSGMWTSLPHFKTGGPWLQVSAPVSRGMSGSGAFDDQGELVGILSSISNAPDMAFYTPAGSVRAFLDQI